MSTNGRASPNNSSHDRRKGREIEKKRCVCVCGEGDTGVGSYALLTRRLHGRVKGK